MANITIVLQDTGIRALLKSPEIVAICAAEADKMTKATGVDYKPEQRYTDQRVVFDALDSVKWEDSDD